MKYVMIMWLCINDPFVELKNTCIEQVMPQQFETLEECKMGAEATYHKIKSEKLYFTTFCSKKMLTTI